MMDAMDSETFLLEFTNILQPSPEAIALTTELSAIENWDSMAVMLYISMVEEKCGRTIQPDDIASAKTVEDLYTLATK